MFIIFQSTVLRSLHKLDPMKEEGSAREGRG